MKLKSFTLIRALMNYVTQDLDFFLFIYVKLLFSGEYTFVWRWSFNGADDIYSTCFDVIITSNKAERDTMLNVSTDIEITTR